MHIAHAIYYKYAYSDYFTLLFCTLLIYLDSEWTLPLTIIKNLAIKLLVFAWGKLMQIIQPYTFSKKVDINALWEYYMIL